MQSYYLSARDDDAWDPRDDDGARYSIPTRRRRDADADDAGDVEAFD